jgi:hypothetical protein
MITETNNLPDYLQAIVDKLPLEIQVTQEMITKGTRYRNEPGSCIGARMLETLLPEGYKRQNYIAWGVYDGSMGDVNVTSSKVNYLIDIKADVNVFCLTEPRIVKLKLSKSYVIQKET